MTSNVSKSVITCFSCCGSLLNTNSVKWSQNNSIAIIINRGLYVFESNSDPNESTQQQFPYHKTFIENPNETLSFDSGLYVTELLSSCSLDEQHLLMLDPTLITDNSNAPNFRAFRSVDWSPLCPQMGCLLALLTLDHRLVIYRKMRNSWHLTIDLSLLLNQQLKESWNSVESLESPNYSIYRQRIYSLATVAFCWAHKWHQSGDSSNRVCALYLGSKNGLVTIWNITIAQQISAQLVYKWKTGFDQITCLKSFDDFLIVSAFNGLVSVIHSGFCFDDLPNPLSLWSEEDDIGVYHLAVKRSDENTFDVLFTKSVFVVLCRVRAEKIGNSITMTLKCCKSIRGLHEMPSTGLCPIIESKYLMTSMDGRLIEIEVLPDLSLNQYEVSLSGINSSSMCAYGIDCSPNASLCALVQILSVYHDHLVIKDPIQIIIFSNISFDYLTGILNDNYLSETPLKPSAVMAQCLDYLDCIRAFLSTNSPEDSFLFSFICNEDVIMNCNDLFKLRLIRFIARTFITNCKTKFSESNYSLLKSRAQLCEDMILRLFIQNLYNTFISDSEYLSDLSPDQIKSLNNMNSWLFKRFEIQIINNNEIDFESIAEMCPICMKEIKFQNKSFGTCIEKHHFLRCTNSLLLCDFVNYKYEKCIRCQNSIVINPPVWRQLSICLYCD